MARRRRTHSSSVELPDADELARLQLSPEVAWFLVSRGMPLPDCPPLIKTPEPREVPGARFDPELVDKVLATFLLLRHTQGQWAGRPLKPDSWQVAYILAPVFGWVHHSEDAGGWVRVITDLYIEVPRKNGKTTLVGGICIYMAFADGEPGAQVYAAATSTNQARYVFDPLKHLAENSPKLRPHVRTLTTKIIHPRSTSYIQVISSVAEAVHGANIHCGAIDELHVHKKPDLTEAIETGTGSRRQPLTVKITTADDSRQDTIYARRRDNIERLARGVAKDPTTYGVIWAAEEGDEPFAEATMRKANPGYGISPTRAYLKRKAAKAEGSPADLAAYLRLHLGIRTKQQTKYLELPVWDRNASMVDEARLAGREAYGGLDLANTSDLCALAWDFPNGDGSHDVIWRFWLPERAYDRLNERTSGLARVWRDRKLITVTPGDVTDYDYIRTTVNADREKFDVRAVAYDPWNASQLVNDLVADEAPMVKIRQGFVSMSAPTKALLHLLLDGTAERPQYRHGGNPVMRWMVDNLAVAMDAAGNVKPDRASAADKIDGVVAAVMALDRAINREPERRSAYEDQGLEVV